MPVWERDRHGAPGEIVCERPTGPRVAPAFNRGSLVPGARPRILVVVADRAVAFIAEHGIAPTLFLAARSLAGTLLAWHLVFATLMMMGVGGETPPTVTPSTYTGPGDVVSGAKAWWGLRAYSAATAGNKIANVCTTIATVDTCVDMFSSATTGNMVILTIGGLTCDNSVVLCNIKTLYDQSGTSCAGSTACDITQATAAKRAALTISCLGGLPCMTFVAASQQEMARVSGSGTLSLSQPITLSTVATATSFPTATGSVFVQDNGSVRGTYFRFSNTPGIELNAGSAFTASAAASTIHAVQAVSNNASSVLYVDGSQSTGTDGTGVLNSGDSMQVGNDQFNDFLQGKIFELGIWSSGFSTPNQSSMNSNQHAYWGF